MNTLRDILSLTLLTCFIAATWGCDNQTQAQAKPMVVRKKILASQAVSALPGGNATTGAPVVLAPKSDIAQAKVTRAPQRAAAKRPGPVAAFRPKSDIAATPAGGLKVVAKSQPPPVAEAPAPSTSPLTVEPTAAHAAPTPAPASPQEPKASEASPEPVATTPPTTVAVVSPNELTKPVPTTPGLNGDPVPYNPQGKIDPFEPLFKDEPEAPPIASKKKKRIPRTPLEKIDLGQLKLVGIILATSGNRALVQEASGKGYIIKEGTYIGLNSGKVVDIKKDRVLVEEEIEDIVGNPSIRNKELVLPKPPGE